MPEVPTRRRAGVIALCSVLAVGGVAGAEPTSAAKKKKATVITSKQIKNGTIAQKDLAKSVRTKLDAGAKALKVIANGSVGTAQLADNSISSAKIAALAVTTAKLAEGAVTTGKLGDASVTTAKLADGSVTNPKLGDDAVNSAKVAPGSLGADDLAPNAVTSDKIGPNGTSAIDFNSIAANACTTDTTINTGKALTADILLVTADENLNDGITVRASPVSSLGTNIKIVACNVTGGAINPDNVVFSWAVLEN